MTASASTRTLSILSGLHAGAQRVLPPGEYVLGSGAGCDIILRDPGVAERHLLLVLGEVTVFAKRLADAPWSCSGKPVTAARQLLSERDVLSFGSVQIGLAPTEPAQEADDAGMALPATGQRRGAGVRRRTTHRVGRRMSVLSASLLMVACGLLFAFKTAVSGVSERSRGEQSLIDAKQLINSLNLPDLQARLDAKGGLVLSGHVDTAQDAQRLRGSAALYANGTPTLKFHVASELAQHATEYLDDPGLSVKYVGHGRLLVAGRSTRAGTRARKEQLVNDMRGVAAIEVVATLIDSAAPDVTSMELPVKVVGIYDALGSGAYFRSDDGTQYSQGNVLKNGAEVVSISSSQIVFRLAGKVFSYRAPETGVIRD
jgi:hypothetical protein